MDQGSRRLEAWEGDVPRGNRADREQIEGSHDPALREPFAPKATFLSFVWPGLGQWYLRRRVAALVYAAPPLIVIGALLSLAADGIESLAGRLFNPSASLLILGAIVALGAWRLLSMADAWLDGRSLERRAAGDDTRRRRPLVVAAALVMVVAVVAVHAVPASLVLRFHEAGSEIFRPDGPVAQPPVAPPPLPSPAPGSSPLETAPPPLLTPIPTIPPDVSDDGLINVLFVGTDSMPGRPPDHRLADSITLATFDPVRGTLDMVSIPRNVSRFPQYWGGLHEGKINTLLSRVQGDPAGYPDGPMETFVQQVSYLMGVDIDYYATVDIPGFQRLIDAVGGIQVEVTEPIADPDFPLYLDPGVHQMDGRTAMMYVRSRKGPGGSNEQRSLRQQQVLLELRRKLSDPQMIPRLPEILDALAATVRSDLPPGRLDETLRLARAASDAEVSQVFLGPEEYARELPPTETDLENAVELRMDAVAALSVERWGDASYYSDPEYLDDVMTAGGARSR